MWIRTFSFVLLSLFVWSTDTLFAQTPIPPRPIGWPSDRKVTFGDRYGLVSFQLSQLSLTEQHKWLVGLVDKLFGVAEEGEYIVAVELIDTAVAGDERIVARKVVAHFVKKDRGFFGPGSWIQRERSGIHIHKLR
jgi:hypothetical protein